MFLVGHSFIPTHNSDALLMAALQFVQIPTYSALLLRRSFRDLEKADSLIPRAHQWLNGTGARWNDNKKRWTFPSGATLEFGYMDHTNDVYQYQGAAYNFVGWDELTQFEEFQYTYLLSRLRRHEGSDIPLRIRSASNPGGVGHQWVYERFVATGARFPFIPALLDDNPFIDIEQYESNLAELDETLRMQLRKGLWVVDPRGKPYDMSWWAGTNRYDPSTPHVYNRAVSRILSYDTASKTDDHNAYTARVAFELLPDYRVIVRDAWKDRVLGTNVPDFVVQDATRWNYDEKLAAIVIEDRDSGVTAIQALRQRQDWISNLVRAFNPALYGDKLRERPQRAALHCKRGSVLLPSPHEKVPWLRDFERDLEGFPHITFKDSIDAFNQGVIYLEHILAEGWRAREGLSHVA
ncbi:MAG: hypothetical protein IT364_24590 [Candidatus Hydrogenedentes bacterium]|nr:hypothetical protein [Candidatus Hydrogenedentota bacterium]